MEFNGRSTTGFNKVQISLLEDMHCMTVISSSRFAGFVSVFKLHWYYNLLVKTQNVISSEGQIGLSLVSE